MKNLEPLLKETEDKFYFVKDNEVKKDDKNISPIPIKPAAISHFGFILEKLNFSFKKLIPSPPV